MILQTSICFECCDKQTNKKHTLMHTIKIELYHNEKKNHKIQQRQQQYNDNNNNTMKQILGHDEIVHKILKFYLVVLTTLHHVRSGNIIFI